MEQTAIVKKNVNVAFRITAIPERIQNVEKQVEATGIPWDSVYIDKAHNGNIWNKFRVLADVANSKEYSHVCMNDDDLIMPRNFTDAVNCLVQRFPNSIFTFYNSKVGGTNPQIFRMKNHYMNGASCVIPKGIINDFIAFYSAYLNGFRWDDTSVSMYALLNDIDVLLPVPKLVDVAHLQSSLPMRKGKFQPCNSGAVYNGLINIDELLNAPVADINGSRLNTHLPENHEIRIACENKLKGMIE